MKLTKQFLIVSSILSALCTAYSGAASAKSTEKTLTLSLRRSEPFLKVVPKLSLSNGPLAEDETSIGLAIDMEAFLDLFANYKVLMEKKEGFFREARNFRDARAEIKIKQVDGTIATTAFRLESNAPDEGIIKLSEFLLGVSAEVVGTVDVYKCFDANTCVLEGTRFERSFSYGDTSVFVKHNFRALVGCQRPGVFIWVEGSIDHPEIQRIIIHRSIARRYLKVNEVITAKSTPVLTGAEFEGFTTNIGEFGLYGEPDPGTTLEVTRENDKLSIVTRFPDGKFRSSYGFAGCVNYHILQ
jgi:hypothetical protein